jgi:hypothetical protein
VNFQLGITVVILIYTQPSLSKVIGFYEVRCFFFFELPVVLCLRVYVRLTFVVPPSLVSINLLNLAGYNRV